MKKRKNAAATMIRAGCLLLDQAYNDNEKRMSAKIPLPISSSSVGSVGEPDITSILQPSDRIEHEPPSLLGSTKPAWDSLFICQLVELAEIRANSESSFWVAK